jgi:hypothetical protein
MVERSLSMREVPGSIPGASKLFFWPVDSDKTLFECRERNFGTDKTDNLFPTGEGPPVCYDDVKYMDVLYCTRHWRFQVSSVATGKSNYY